MKSFSKTHLQRCLFWVAALSLATPGYAERSALYYYGIGTQEAERGEHRSAVANFRQALERNPAYPEAHLGAANSYFELGDWRRAREHYERVIDLDETSLPARTGLGLVYVQIGNFDGAERVLMEVRRSDPGSADNNHALGVYYHRSGHQSLAVAYFEKAIRTSPSHVPALLGLARVQAEQGRLGVAREYLTRARRIQPMHPHLHASLGEIELQEAFEERDETRRSDYLARAREAFQTAQELAPELRSIRERLIMIDLYSGDVDSAMEQARRLLDSSSEDPTIHYLLGSLMKRDGRSASRAVESLKRALSIEPGDSTMRYGLEEAVLASGNVYPPGSPVRRELAAYHLSRANQYQARQQLARMRHHLERSLLLYPFSREALELKLELARREGDYEQFLRVLNVLRVRNPDDLRLQNRLAAALDNRRRNLAYRAQLYSPDVPQEATTFARTPLRVFVFDIEPTGTFPRHPDGGELIAAAIRFELSSAGHVQSESDAMREMVLRSIANAHGKRGFPFGIFYRAEFIPLIEEAENRHKRVHYILHGNYREIEDGLRLELQLSEKQTGTRVDSFVYQLQGRDALPGLAILVARRLRDRLKPVGRIVRVDADEVFINLGSADGIQQNQTFRVERRGTTRGSLACPEVARYIARCESQERDRLDPGDIVVPGPVQEN